MNNHIILDELLEISSFIDCIEHLTKDSDLPSKHFNPILSSIGIRLLECIGKIEAEPTEEPPPRKAEVVKLEIVRK